MSFVYNILKTIGIDRRRHERISCNIKAHFLIMDSRLTQRGTTQITDISYGGMGCDELFFTRNDNNKPIPKNTKIELYFSIFDSKTGRNIPFEIRGKIRSILKNDQFGASYRFGVKINSFKKGTRAAFKQAIEEIIKTN